ncbi:hypothetical protein NFI96_029155, partial [Prochilodus magdalenae]
GPWLLTLILPSVSLSSNGDSSDQATGVFSCPALEVEWGTPSEMQFLSWNRSGRSPLTPPINKYVKVVNISTQVTVVGIIRRTKPAVGHVVYSLDDMTGPLLDVKQWMDLEDVNMNDCVIPPGTYIKAVGSLRSFQHHRSMVGFSVRRVEDLNEITSHMLEVVQAHLLNDDSFSRVSMNKATTSIMSMSRSSDSTSNGFTANQSQVLNLIKSCSSAKGISIRSLSTALKYLSPYDIRTCLNFLINEGHVFSTVDDEHFRSTCF